MPMAARSPPVIAAPRTTPDIRRYACDVSQCMTADGSSHFENSQCLAMTWRKTARLAVELGVRAYLRPRVRSNGDRLGERVPGPGTGYMLGRLADERQVADLIARIHEPLATLARRSARRPSSAGSGAFKAAYLVDRDRIEPFRRRVDELAEDVEGASVVCTGPWPPYSFTSGQEG